MIRLFVSDIDGCLSEPYRPFVLSQLQVLAAFGLAAEEGQEVYPRLSLCSGRAFPYVEAMTQVLGIRVPVVFEGGGGMYDPVTARITWNPVLTPEISEELDDVRRWMLAECIPGSKLTYDFAKRTQAGVIGPGPDEVAATVLRVQRYVAESHPSLCVYHTPISVDVSVPGMTKREGMHWLARICGISTAEVAFIGDTNGDVGALQEVGYGFAPSNAAPEAKAVASSVTRGAAIEGVLEAYRWCVACNEAGNSGVEHGMVA